MSPAEWDDGVADAVALVIAVTGEDLVGAGVLLRNADLGAVAAVLAKCLGEAAMEAGACPEHFREWAARAVARP